MRDTARAPQPPTDPPTGHRISLHGLAQIDQKCQFWAKFGCFWAKNPFFYWRNQKFCYPHNGKPTQAPCSHLFLVGHWTKCAKNGNIWPKMTKNADFGPNLAVFGPKILIFMGVSKSFGTNITENHLDNLSALFFGQALDQMGQKCQYLAQNDQKYFGPNLAVFGPKILIFMGLSKSFGTNITKTTSATCPHCFLVRH